MPFAAKRLRALLFLAPLLWSTLALPAGARFGREELDKIHAVATLCQQRYYREVTPAQLLQSAARGLERELKGEPLAPPDVTSSQVFDRYFLECSRVHPELAQEGRLAEASIRGMLEGLEDPYTAYLTAGAFEEYLDALGGNEVSGVGLLIDQREDTGEVVVLDVVEDSPALRQGIRTGDVLVSVDGSSASALGYQEVRRRLGGDPGSRVAVECRRERRTFGLTLTRAPVRLNSVVAELLTDGSLQVGYLRIRLFGADTGAELKDAMARLEASGAQAYVLDLRNNGGGYLQSAVAVCSAFLPSQTLVVSVRERTRPERPHYSEARPGSSRPLVILINQHSASASEVTAAALRDQGRAVLVGHRSFGKGSVQKLIRLPDESALKLTTAHYFTPRGVDLNGVGLQPDLSAQMPLSALGTPSDVQLSRALELLVSVQTTRRAAGAANSLTAATPLEEETVTRRPAWRRSGPFQGESGR